MIRVPEDCEDRDIQRWLYHVFMHGTPSVPYYLQSVREGVVAAMPVMDVHAGLVRLPAHECYAHWPKLGSFNLRDGGDAVYLSRNTQRQWHRSLCPDTLLVRKLDNLAGLEYMGSGQYVHVPFLHDPYPPALRACAMVLADERNSVAITRRVAVGRSMCPGKLSLFVDGDLAGTVHGSSVSLFSDGAENLVSKVFGEWYEVTKR